MNQSDAKHDSWEAWIPAVFLAIAISFAYAFAIWFRVQIGSWPDSPVDWVPLDRGGHEGLVALGSAACFLVLIALLILIIWSVLLIVRRLALKREFPIRPLIWSWLLAAAFLLIWGARFLIWMLD